MVAQATGSINPNQTYLVILNLEKLRGRVDSTKIVKEPTSSVDPVAPNLLLNTAVALFMSLIFFSFLAFVLDFVSMNRDLISAKNEEMRSLSMSGINTGLMIMLPRL